MFGYWISLLMLKEFFSDWNKEGKIKSNRVLFWSQYLEKILENWSIVNKRECLRKLSGIEINMNQMKLILINKNNLKKCKASTYLVDKTKIQNIF